jgi:hypothetical protein
MPINLDTTVQQLCGLFSNLLGMPAGSFVDRKTLPVDYLTNTTNRPTAQQGVLWIKYASPGSWSEPRFANQTATNNVQESRSAPWNFVVSTTIFRGDALNKLVRLTLLMELNSTVQSLEALGLACADIYSQRVFIGDLQVDYAKGLENQSIAMGNVREERAGVDFVFSTLVTETKLLPSYGTFPVQVNLDNQLKQSLSLTD